MLSPITDSWAGGSGKLKTIIVTLSGTHGTGKSTHAGRTYYLLNHSGHKFSYLTSRPYRPIRLHPEKRSASPWFRSDESAGENEACEGSLVALLSIRLLSTSCWGDRDSESFGIQCRS